MPEASIPFIFVQCFSSPNVTKRLSLIRPRCNSTLIRSRTFSNLCIISDRTKCNTTETTSEQIISFPVPAQSARRSGVFGVTIDKVFVTLTCGNRELNRRMRWKTADSARTGYIFYLRGTSRCLEEKPSTTDCHVIDFQPTAL